MNKELSDKEKLHYARHLSLKEIGEKGQLALKSAKVAVVGIGGLGVPCSLYLAGAGVGTILLIDDDIVEASNLHRQPLYNVSDIGKPKVLAASRELKAKSPFINIEQLSVRLTASNVFELLKDLDLIVDGTDSFVTRYILSDACDVLKTPLLSASLGDYEGQISLFSAPQKDGSLGPSYRCLYPTPPLNNRTCSESGIIGTVSAVMGCIQANEAIKFICGFSDNLSGKLLVFNLLSLTTTTFSFSRISPPKTTLLSQEEYEAFCGKNINIPKVSENEIELRLSNGEQITLLDIREPYEIDEFSRDALRIPLRELSERISEVPKDHLVAVYCPGEIRNVVATRKLRDEFGFSNAFALVSNL